MGEDVALAFAADVEEAVAAVRELQGNAQELAGTAKEAADSVAGIGAAGGEAAGGVREVADSAASADESLAAMRTALEENAQAVGFLTDAVERLSAAVDANTAATDANAGAQEGAAAKSGAAAASHGKLKLAILGVAVAAGLAVHAGAVYQDQTTHLVTDAGESAKNLAMVQQGILGVSAATGTAAGQIDDAMYHIESAGFHGASGLSVLTVAAEGAKVGGAQLDTIGKTLTGTMNAYGMSSADATKQTKMSVAMMNELIAAVGAGDMKMEDLASSLGNVAPVAATAKISFAQVGGAIATMTAQNMSAQQATQDLRHTIVSLSNPNAVAVKEMKALGLSARDIQSNLGKRGLTGTLDLITEAARKNAGALGQTYVQAVAKATGGTTGMNTTLMLTGTHMASFTENVKTVAAAAAKGGDSVDNWSTIQSTFNFKLAQAKASIMDTGIALGMALLPAVTAMLGPLAHFLSLIAQNRVAAIAFAVVIGGILSAYVGSKLFGAFRDVAGSVESFGRMLEPLIARILVWTGVTEAQTAATEAATVAQTEMDIAETANPIGLVILAIVALIAVIVLLVTHWRQVWGFLKAAGLDAWHVLDNDVLHPIEKGIGAVVSWVAKNWKAIAAWLIDPVGMAVFEIRTHLHQIAHGFDDARHAVAATLDNLRHDIASAFDWVRHFVASSVDETRHLIAADWDRVRHDTAALIDAVTGFFQRLPGQILHELETLPGQMLTMGWNIITGLIHGIEAAASAIPSLMSGLAHTVESYFTNPLKMFSPSRVMHEHGANIVRGIINGVLSQVAALRAVMRSLGTGVAAGGIGGYGAGGYSSTAAGGQVNVTVPLQVAFGAGTAGLAHDPGFLQYIQSVVQEAVLHYNVNNPGNGLAIAAGGRSAL